MGPRLVTPRGSIADAADPVVDIRAHDRRLSFDYANFDPKDIPGQGVIKKSSRRTLRSKASFSSWRSSFSHGSGALQVKNRQDENEDKEPIDPDQFQDAQTPPTSKQPGSSHMDHGLSNSSHTSSDSTTSRTASSSTRKLISSLKRLGVTLRPNSVDQAGSFQIRSSRFTTSVPVCRRGISTGCSSRSFSAVSTEAG